MPSAVDATSEQVVERTLEMLRTRNRARGGLRKAFRTYDLDKSGTVEKGEFKDLIKRLNCQLTPNEFDMLWDKFDRDGDGCVYADEFCDAVFRDEQSATTPFATPVDGVVSSLTKRSASFLTTTPASTVTIPMTMMSTSKQLAHERRRKVDAANFPGRFS